MRIKKPPVHYLTSIGVGRQLGIGPARVRQLAREGRITAAVVLPTGQRLFDAGAVDDLARRRERSARDGAGR